MGNNFAIFDTVTLGFTAFASKPVVEQEDGSGYISDGGTYVFTTDDEAVARGEVERMSRQLKQPGRYKLFVGQFTD